MPKRGYSQTQTVTRTSSFSKPKRRKQPKRTYSSAFRSAEVKFLDTNIGTAIGTVAQTLESANLVIIPQGDTESSRQGRKVMVKKIHCKGELVLTAATAAANTSETVKVYVLQDKQTNNAQFTAAQLLESDVMFSFRNLANQKRFKILWQDTICLQAGGAAASGAAFVFSEARQKFSCNLNVNIPITYDNSDTDGAIDTQTENTLYFVTQSATGAIVTLTGQARVRYTDL